MPGDVRASKHHVNPDAVTSSSGNISISDMQRISEPGLYVVSLVPFNSVGDPGFVIGLARVHDFFSGRDRLPLAVQQPGVSRSAQGKNQGTVFDRFDLEEKVVIRIRLRRELDMADGIRVVFQFDDLSLSGVDEILLLSCQLRSEERRVGKECRSRWSPYH